MNPYFDALIAAMNAFRASPTQAHLDTVNDAGNAYMVNVGDIPNDLYGEIISYRVGVTPSGGALVPAGGGSSIISAQGIRIGNITLPWLGLAIVAGLVVYVNSRKSR